MISLLYRYDTFTKKIAYQSQDVITFEITESAEVICKLLGRMVREIETMLVRNRDDDICSGDPGDSVAHLYFSGYRATLASVIGPSRLSRGST